MKEDCQRNHCCVLEHIEELKRSTWRLDFSATTGALGCTYACWVLKQRDLYSPFGTLGRVTPLYVYQHASASRLLSGIRKALPVGIVAVISVSVIGKLRDIGVRAAACAVVFVFVCDTCRRRDITSQKSDAPKPEHRRPHFIRCWYTVCIMHSVVTNTHTQV